MTTCVFFPIIFFLTLTPSNTSSCFNRGLRKRLWEKNASGQLNTHTHIHAHAHAHARTRTHTYIHTCIHTYMHTYTLYIYKYLHTDLFIHLHACSNTHAHYYAFLSLCSVHYPSLRLTTTPRPLRQNPSLPHALYCVSIEAFVSISIIFLYTYLTYIPIYSYLIIIYVLFLTCTDPKIHINMHYHYTFASTIHLQACMHVALLF